MFSSLRNLFLADVPSDPPQTPPPAERSVIFVDRWVGAEHFIMLRGVDHRELVIRSTRDFVAKRHHLFVFALPSCQVDLQTEIIQALWRIPGIAQIKATAEELVITIGVLHDREKVAPQVESTLIAWLEPKK